jgi:multidrug efflux pump subunit AcrA (membrane-fusion protein)
VQIRIDALPDRRVAGRIRRIFPAADTATRLVPVEVAIEADDARAVRPGFLARVTFELGEEERALVAPLGAVSGAAGQQSAFVVRGGRAERRPVRTGTIAQGRIEIVEGLAAGDTVIVTRPVDLRDGAAVRTVVRPALAPDTQPEAQPGTRTDTQAATRPEGS